MYFKMGEVHSSIDYQEQRTAHQSHTAQVEECGENDDHGAGDN